MAYKPFPMESAVKGRWNGRIFGPPTVEHSEVPDVPNPGTSLRRKAGGVYAIPKIHAVIEPTPIARKAPSKAQLNASYCRYLEERGWKSRRIAEFLRVKLAFVSSVVLMLTYKGCGPIRPPNYEDVDK